MKFKLYEGAMKDACYHYTKTVKNRNDILNFGFKLNNGEVDLTESIYYASSNGIFGVKIYGIDSLNFKIIDGVPNPKDYENDGQHDGMKYRRFNEDYWTYIVWNVDKLNNLKRVSFIDDNKLEFVSLNVSNFDTLDIVNSFFGDYDVYGVNSKLLSNEFGAYTNAPKDIICPCYIHKHMRTYLQIVPLEKFLNDFESICIPIKDCIGNIYKLK